MDSGCSDPRVDLPYAPSKFSGMVFAEVTEKHATQRKMFENQLQPHHDYLRFHLSFEIWCRILEWTTIYTHTTSGRPGTDLRHLLHWW